MTERREDAIKYITEIDYKLDSRGKMDGEKGL